MRRRFVILDDEEGFRQVVFPDADSHAGGYNRVLEVDVLKSHKKTGAFKFLFKRDGVFAGVDGYGNQSVVE